MGRFRKKTFCVLFHWNECCQVCSSLTKSGDFPNLFLIKSRPATNLLTFWWLLETGLKARIVLHLLSSMCSKRNREVLRQAARLTGASCSGLSCSQSREKTHSTEQMSKCEKTKTNSGSLNNFNYAEFATLEHLSKALTPAVTEWKL